MKFTNVDDKWLQQTYNISHHINIYYCFIFFETKKLYNIYGYSAINNTAGSKKRLLTVIGEKEEKGEKTEQSTTISSQTYSTTSGIQTDNSLFQRKKPVFIK